MLDIIGGTDLYKLDGLDIHERLGGDTPFGTPSGEVLRGTLYSQPVLFLTRYSADVSACRLFLSLLDALLLRPLPAPESSIRTALPCGLCVGATGGESLHRHSPANIAVGREVCAAQGFL
jgi:hypothetical protein